MSTVQDVIRIAASEVGTTEQPPGSNRTEYAAEAGHLNGYAWCATYVVAMFRRAGIKLPNESAYTPTMLNGFFASKAGTRGSKGIAAGDVVFFNFDRGSLPQHVGIVVSVNKDGSLITLEGNTSAGDAGSQANGGGVFRRIRPAKYVVGFGRPAYSKELAPMFNPPHVLEPIVASLACPTGGFWLFGQHGGIYGYEGAPVTGSASGKDYFKGRSAAYGQLVDGFATPQIVATSGETYGPGF
jgi:hypothetical protein